MKTACPMPSGDPTASTETDNVFTRRAFSMSAAAALLTRNGSAYAQGAFATQNIRLVVGYPAGGGVDIVARLLDGPDESGVRPGGAGRKQAGCGGDDRGAIGRPRHARRSHAAGLGVRRGRGQPAHLQGEDDLRSAEGSDAGGACRHRALRGGGGRDHAGQDAGGTDRLRAGEQGKAVLLLVGRRQPAASRRRADEPHGRHRRAACALSRLRAGRD